MRIVRINVERFGKLRNLALHFSPGLNVFYGKNETGKTSTMEFIRNTMYPDNKKNHYPEFSDVDSGVLEYEAAGETHLIERTGKKVTADVMPDIIVPMDPTMHRHIFAMTADDLRVDEEVVSGGVRDSLLTIPGGDLVPKISDDIQSECKAYLGNERKVSTAKITVINDAITANDIEINKNAPAEELYGQSVRERKVLEDRLIELNRMSSEVAENEDRINIRNSQQGNFDELRRLEEEKSSIVRTVTEEEIAEYGSLKQAVAVDHGILGSEGRKLSDLKDTVGCDINKLLSHKDDIERLHGSAQDYRDAVRRIRSGKTKKEPLPIITLLLLVIGIALLVSSAFYRKAVIPGLFTVIIGLILVSKRKKNSIDMDDEAVIRGCRSEMKAIAEDIGIEYTGFLKDISKLHGYLSKASLYEEQQRQYNVAKSTYESSLSELKMFLAQYGGEEGFTATVEDTARYHALEDRILSLKEAIRCSGAMDPVQTTDISGEEIGAEISEINRRLGELDNCIAFLSKEGTMEELYDKRAVLLNDLKENVREWAVLSIERILLNDTCQRSYGECRPMVMEEADSLMRRMTDGRYGLQADLISGTMAAVDGTSVSISSAWSTGLTDQAMLSLKLAIAKQMGGEETVPMILDDVLQMFDSDRKLGACEALLDYSKEVQTIVFTCDAETRDMFEGLGVEIRQMQPL